MADKVDSVVQAVVTDSMSQEDAVKKINDNIQKMVSSGVSISQSSMRDLAEMLEQSEAATGTDGRPSPTTRRGRTTSSSKAKVKVLGKKEIDEMFGVKKIMNSSEMKKNVRNVLDEFTDGVEEQMMKSLFGDPISKVLGKSIKNLAKQLGVSVEDLAKESGKLIGKDIAKKLKGSNDPYVQKLLEQAQSVKDYALKRGKDIISKAGDKLKSIQDENKGEEIPGKIIKGRFNQSEAEDEARTSGESVKLEGPEKLSDVQEIVKAIQEGTSSIVDAITGRNTTEELGNAEESAENEVKDILEGPKFTAEDAGKAGEDIGVSPQDIIGDPAGTAGDVMGEASGEAAGSLLELAASCPELLVAFGAVALAVVGLDIALSTLKKAFAPAVEGFSALYEATSEAADAFQGLKKSQLKNYEERLAADVKSMMEEPFDILKEAAETALDAWDKVEETISATQGYTKEDVQDLYSAYAARLKEEGMESVVSSADIMTNLETVLNSGLSGEVAEEFAYLATVLNEAIPTEDFFDYASTYASIAANAIAAGQSQSEAIEYANEELESFANNVLYASREIAGGFSTGLQDASTLLQDAVRISTASKTGDASEISGVLTSVSALVGAIAPDLADSLVSNIVDSALGGNNNTNLTALRSLAGTGASNTAFLTALAEDPQSVFSTLFTNLAKLQQMSNDNFMEVAEGLSDIFGVSMEAFARVDFNYLANAINNMDTASGSLAENIALLKSGESTSTAEQLRMQQINEYMIDEGLAYVLDNEVARSIQEHMWNEQLAQEIEESTYAVNLEGAALEFLQGISLTVQNIINFLNPFSWTKKIANLAIVANETKALQSDIVALLEKGKVGNGNSTTQYNLTHGNTDLNLTKSYLELLGGTSSYARLSSLQSGFNSITNITNGGLVGTLAKYATKALEKGAYSLLTGAGTSSKATSTYTWGTLGKSAANALSAASSNSGSSAYAALTSTSAQSAISSASATKLQNYLDTMETYIKDNKSYDEWVASASKFGITDVEAALSDYGLTEADAKAKFEEMEAQKASEYEHERELVEDQFWQDMIKFAEEDFPLYADTIYDYNDEIIDLEETLIDKAEEEIEQLIKSNEQLKEFYDEWIDYYVNHTAYSNETLSAYDVQAIKNAEQDETGDAVLALAQALTSNMVDLKDPTVQTNVLLSQILIVAEAIMQQTNTTTTVSLPTALSALGLGTITETTV